MATELALKAAKAIWAKMPWARDPVRVGHVEPLAPNQRRPDLVAASQLAVLQEELLGAVHHGQHERREGGRPRHRGEYGRVGFSLTLTLTGQ
jgi:hypothetical protein